MRAARNEPTRMSANPTPIPVVNDSPRTATPSTAATAGFTYVMTVARTGPISSISAKKRTKASAVQTSASVRIDATTLVGGIAAGSENAAIGTYTSAVIASDAAMTPSAG